MSELEFTEERLERYSRHILLRDVGVEGQMKIFDAKVLIIGAGGLGSPVALYLAAAGVGTLGIADADNVEISNLQRQVILHTPDVGKPKVPGLFGVIQATEVIKLILGAGESLIGRLLLVDCERRTCSAQQFHAWSQTCFQLDGRHSGVGG